MCIVFFYIVIQQKRTASRRCALVDFVRCSRRSKPTTREQQLRTVTGSLHRKHIITISTFSQFFRISSEQNHRHKIPEATLTGRGLCTRAVKRTWIRVKVPWQNGLVKVRVKFVRDVNLHLYARNTEELCSAVFPFIFDVLIAVRRYLRFLPPPPPPPSRPSLSAHESRTEQTTLAFLYLYGLLSAKMC